MSDHPIDIRVSETPLDHGRHGLRVRFVEPTASAYDSPRRACHVNLAIDEDRKVAYTIDFAYGVDAEALAQAIINWRDNRREQEGRS
jgi:hypothetical protein